MQVLRAMASDDGLNLWELFSAVAGTVIERPAIIWRGRTETYGELLERSSRLANVLAGHGLGLRRERTGDLRGWESGQDMVGMYLLNCPEFLEVNLGGYAARCAPFNVNYRYVADELAYLLDDADCAALVYHARFAPVLREVLPRLRRRPVLIQVADESGEALLPGASDYEASLAGAPPEAPALGRRPEDLYVLYTGGTTGMPKGTLWRQADIWRAAIGADKAGWDIPSVVAAVAKTPTRFLTNAPLMHGAAQWIALHQLLGGDTVVINRVTDHFDPVEVCTTTEEEAVNGMLMVGESFARPVLDEIERGHHDLSSLFLILTGGAAMSSETKARLVRALPAVTILDAAGSSESGSPLSQLTSGGAAAEAGVFDADPSVAVLDAELTRRLRPGEDAVGWFAKRGAIPLGYLGDEAKSARTFPTVAGARWTVPGDRARLRADGRVELLGRDAVTINSGGEKIFVEEVEAAAIAHPAVADAVVVGRPDERFGESVAALVQLRHGAAVTDEELREVMGGRLARYKLPRVIIRVPEILRSPAGKADYRWARAVAADRPG